jgi:hypothetical protein
MTLSQITFSIMIQSITKNSALRIIMLESECCLCSALRFLFHAMLTVVMLSVVRGESRGAIELDMQVRSQKGSKVKQTFYNDEQKMYNSERSNKTFFCFALYFFDLVS